MNFDAIKNFFGQLFTQLNTEDSWAIIFFLVIAYLIGTLFGWWAGRRGKRKLRKALKQKESDLITLQAAHEALQEKFEMREKDLEQARLDAEQHQVALEKSERTKNQLQNQLYTTNEQIQQLQSEHQTHLSQIEELNTEIVQLREGSTVVTPVDNTSTEVTGVDQEELTAIKDNYTVTLDRLLAIEAKLGRLEQENTTLREELSSMKDTSAIAFIDDEPDNDADEEITVDIEESTASVTGNTDDTKAVVARQSLKALFGKRIPVATIEDKDDLQKINGIGPFIEGKLNEIGIYNYDQISHLDEEAIQHVTDAIQFFPGRIKRDDWVGQAAALMER